MADDPIDIATPWRRDTAEVAPRLAAWVHERIGPDAKLGELSEPGNGMSSETILFDVHDNGTTVQYVARLAPTPDVYPVFQDYDLMAQKQCMDMVRAHTTVPAPEVPFAEEDPSWLGSPFIVMRRIDGVPPLDVPPYVFGGWLFDASREEQTRVEHNAIHVLTRLHEITPASHDLTFLLRPDFGASAVDQQLGGQRAYYEWARDGVAYPLIDSTFAWLEDRKPDGLTAVFNWGDARIGNMLWRDFAPVAVLDWEMATVGPKEVDLAWMIFLHRFFQDLAERFAMPGLPDFMRRDVLVAKYEELSGQSVEHLEWFEVYAALRFAIVSVRTSTRGIAYGSMDPPADVDDLIMFRGLVEQMLAGTYWR
ncbi:MAG: phosphotransferase family protein [Actinomycetota bacterium]